MLFCSFFSKSFVIVSLYWCCAKSFLVLHHWMRCVFLNQLFVRVFSMGEDDLVFTNYRLFSLQPREQIAFCKYGLSVWFFVQSNLHCLSELNWVFYCQHGLPLPHLLLQTMDKVSLIQGVFLTYRSYIFASSI